MVKVIDIEQHQTITENSKGDFWIVKYVDENNKEKIKLLYGSGNDAMQFCNDHHAQIYNPKQGKEVLRFTKENFLKLVNKKT